MNENAKLSKQGCAGGKKKQDLYRIKYKTHLMGFKVPLHLTLTGDMIELNDVFYFKTSISIHANALREKNTLLLKPTNDICFYFSCKIHICGLQRIYLSLKN